MLHGVFLCGNGDPTCYVELDIIDSYTKSVCVSKTGLFSSEPFQGKNFVFDGYRVSFKKKIILKKNTMYSIRAKISGSLSLRGTGGVSSLKCSGVTFTFRNSENSITGTDVSSGEFPALLFSLFKQ